MEKVIITKVYKSDKNKEGKAIMARGKQAWRVAIQTGKFGDKWFSTLAFAQDDAVMTLNEGDEKTLVLWEQNGYSNFKLPGKIDFLEQRIERLEKMISNQVPKSSLSPNEANALQNLREQHNKAADAVNEINAEDIPF